MLNIKINSYVAFQIFKKVINNKFLIIKHLKYFLNKSFPIRKRIDLAQKSEIYTLYFCKKQRKNHSYI